jgi:cytochrome c biogenesis protein CcdA
VAVTLSSAAALARLDAAAPPGGASLALLCELAGPPAAALGVALAPAALAAMAPCLLQLAAALVAAVAGVTATSAPLGLRRAGLAFAGGFLAVYAAAALAVGLAGELLAPWAFLLRAIGGALLALLGLALLRVLPRRAAPGCKGPRWLILTGRASLRRPVGAGAALAVYCLGCCGPYLAGVALLGAGAGSPVAGPALLLGFAALMAALLLLPVFAVGAARRLQAALAGHGPALALLAGAPLVALGVALALEPLLVYALTR